MMLGCGGGFVKRFPPLTTTQLDMASTRKMVDEMFEANKSLLPQFYKP